LPPFGFALVSVLSNPRLALTGLGSRSQLSGSISVDPTEVLVELGVLASAIDLLRLAVMASPMSGTLWHA
jgi:hypothetical protein